MSRNPWGFISFTKHEDATKVRCAIALLVECENALLTPNFHVKVRLSDGRGGVVER